MVGTYTIWFTATDAAGNVHELTGSFEVQDTTAPIITLNGSGTMTLEVHDTYIEPDAIAWDHYDGDVTSSIVVSGIVNTGIVGTYYVYYNVVDANGNHATEVMRTVHIVTPPKV